MSMQKSTTKAIYIALGITTCAAIFKLAHTKYKQSKQNSSSNLTDATTRTNHESIALLKPLFEKAAQQAKSLTLNQNDQLMLYGLYKQAKIGNVNMKQPSRLNIVAWKKFHAWSKFNSMPQHFAMMKYLEVVEHFTLSGSGSASASASAAAGGEDAVLNVMDDSDIVYEDESSVDLSVDDDDDDEHDTLDLGNEMSIGKKQSTLGGGANYPQDDFDGDISILQAASSGNTEFLQQIIDSGDDVNERDENGQSALHMAADKGNVDCVTILLKSGADPNAADKEGISVLEAAVIGGSVAAVKILLDAGSDPDHEDMDGDTPRSCAEDDDNDEMKFLLRTAEKSGENDTSFNSIQSQVSC
jgi:acyl-CoA-binding protein